MFEHEGLFMINSISSLSSSFTLENKIYFNDDLTVRGESFV